MHCLGQSSGNYCQDKKRCFIKTNNIIVILYFYLQFILLSQSLQVPSWRLNRTSMILLSQLLYFTFVINFYLLRLQQVGPVISNKTNVLTVAINKEEEFRQISLKSLTAHWSISDKICESLYMLHFRNSICWLLKEIWKSPGGVNFDVLDNIPSFFLQMKSWYFVSKCLILIQTFSFIPW